nr:hypothetical protein [Arthrospira sp. PLM2.Bin9]
MSGRRQGGKVGTIPATGEGAKTFLVRELPGFARLWQVAGRSQGIEKIMRSPFTLTTDIGVF